MDPNLRATPVKNAMPDCLFLYGTLHPDRAPAAIRSTARLLQSRGPATVVGTLYQLGRYPGLLLPGPAPRIVPGELFLLPPDAESLASLDAYEDFRPADPAGSLFLRIETEATLPDESRKSCWVYVYNRPIPPDRSSV
jgi:gamma-glutamylcyclotransferase (GGCT)/AIG2-like uncharacterized protein YtfP